MLGACKPIYTGVEACAAAKGDNTAIFRTAWHILTRTGLFAAAMFPLEKNPKKLAQQALGASLGIETFVWAWNWATDCEALPSGQVACDFVEGKKGSALGVAGTVALRSGLIATGIGLWGESRPKELLKKTAASVTLLELVILAQALANYREDEKQPESEVSGCSSCKR